MSKIKNKNYRKFLDDGIIDIIELDQIKKAVYNCDGIRGRHIKEGRALLIYLYYTGCRPIEASKSIAKDISKKDSYVQIKVPQAKRGLPRTLFFPYRFSLIKELYHYSTRLYPNMLLFFNYISKYERKLKNGKTRIEVDARIRYYINKWFERVIDGSIPPYFLRHNRISQLAMAGLNDAELQTFKGSRTTESIQYYKHLSARSAKKIARHIK